MTRAAGYSRPVPRDAVRILTTNDFVALFFPQATSYGGLPGAAALQATVDELRDAAGGGAPVARPDWAQRRPSISRSPRPERRRPLRAVS